ncbi:MAG: hypothetical protein RL335_1468 [Bacteroidota bacterium]
MRTCTFFLFLLGVTLFPAFSLAQCVLEVSGVVSDLDTRARLADATILVRELNRSVVTTRKGEYSVKGLCPGSYTLVISHISCKEEVIHIDIKGDLHRDIELGHAAAELQEVIVRGSAGAGTTAVVAELKGRQLDATRGLSLGESLRAINGVTTLQTGNNIYKPVIHGLHSNRVLILNNGIRQEGQQWGSEHAPEIDPFLANRLTVIKGASSIRYGGDAIGGVVLVEPKLLPYGTATVNGEWNTAFFSNNRQGVLSAMIEGSPHAKKDIAWRLQGTAKRGGNAHTPDYGLANSGIEELNMSATVGKRKQHSGSEFFYSLFSTRIGIFSGSHIGNVTDLMEAIRLGEPPRYIKNVPFTYRIDRPYQQVMHHLLKWKSFKDIGHSARINVTGSYQFNQRREYDIVRSTTRIAPQLQLGLHTAGLDAVLDHFGGKGLKGSVGISGMYQINQYTYRYFIPNYQSLSLGLFIAEKYTIGNWVIEGGARFDYKNIRNITDNDAAPFHTLMGGELAPGIAYGKRNFNGLSGNIGLNYHQDNWKFVLSGTTAWRAPQVNELFSNGLHHGAARIETGRSDLQTERSLGIASAIEYHDEKLFFDIDVYHKRISDFIYLRPSFPPQLTIRGAFPTFAFDQTDARLNGIDIQLSYLVDHHLRMQAKGSLLRAKDLVTNDWLIQMPADRYEVSAEYLLKDGRKFRQSYMKASVQHVRQQTRVPSTGNIELPVTGGGTIKSSDYATPPPAYTLSGIEFGTKLDVQHRDLSIILSVTNLFNIRYRDYMNAFRYFADDMGRNISLRIKVPLIIKQKMKHNEEK